MSAIEQIKAVGTINPDFSRSGKPSGKITCRDGFTLSVQAGIGMYCSPRPRGFGNSPDRSYQGPYTSAEVGYPSVRPEPWDSWKEFCENVESPSDSVYGDVPFALIEALIDAHGGEKS